MVTSENRNNICFTGKPFAERVKQYYARSWNITHKRVLKNKKYRFLFFRVHVMSSGFP